MAQTLYIIDGYAQFFRAYHAIRTPMSSPVTKEPTNMTFGFIGMLLKLLRGDGAIGGKPAYVALALDVGGDRGTFRSQIYPEYKANRPPPPEDLFPQVDRCLAMLAELGVPVIGSEGFEADDVIATMVSRFRASNPELNIRIISKDKDLKQLLSPGVELFDIHTEVIFSHTTLKEALQLEPAQVIDMLALMGDTVDNVPGVDGVGEKTAALLIAEYGTAEAVLAAAADPKSKLTPKRRENLLAAKDQLPLSRSLVTLRHDVPIDFALPSATTTQFKIDKLLPILKELGFNRFQDEARALIGLAPEAKSVSAPPKTSLKEQAPAGSLFAASSAAPAAPVAPKLAAFSGPSLFDSSPVAQAATLRDANANYICITTKDQLKKVVAEITAAPIFAFDTETSGLSPFSDYLCGISLSTKPGTGYYIPVRSPDLSLHLDEATVLAALKPIFEDASRPKCGHNLKFDMLFLRQAGVKVRGLTHPQSCDSMIGSFLIDASRSSHSLDALALALLKHTNISITELIGTGKNQKSFDSVPLDQATQYAAEDADVALQLCNIMMPQLQAMGLHTLMHSLEMPLVDVLAELEHNGILVDPDELDRQRARLNVRIDELLLELKRESVKAFNRAFDPDSPKQLAAALFNKPDDDVPGLGIKPTKKTKTGFSTDADVLETLAENVTLDTPIPKLILEYRQLAKLVNTYLVALKDAIQPKTRRIHASFHQTVAITGRLASSDPNLQNIPIRTDLGRDIRKAFIAPPGRVLVTADYSQIELRLLAHLSRDPALIAAFLGGEDIHTAVAAQINGIPISEVTRDQRSGAKMVNFGIVYGITAFGLAQRLGCSKERAGEIITGYKRKFSGITTFLEECIDQARRMGYVETMMKRRRPIPEIESTNPARRALAERTAINTVVQGSAADLIKIAMVDLHARLSPAAAHLRNNAPAAIPNTLMLLQIHDELVFETDAKNAPAAQELIVSRMEAAMSLTVPLKADAHIATNWFEGK